MDQHNVEHVQRPRRSQDDTLFASLIYVGGFFAPIIAPLIIWLIKRDDSTFVDQAGKDYFNYIISYTIWSFVGLALCLILIGFVILPILSIVAFVFHIVAIFKLAKGEPYLIPLSLRIFK
ncbi:DUF4870 domain-containing protein [Staphylococcus massiliensis]|uniref:DUF4870 domain-containing protein n=1 Tax=Staphylococcus massiliensis S46 TaxID=1229783 RepID=K9ANV2_9STAP|nr:DUF4870 domain-containing protein [Staphylococcus massiliensis]EKU48974.1 hypothetical protein C273_04185 [Staphylococcus massiliensis S46]MCG3399414.1 DUF4870 domain-containing protein [Staphylococcus massiliensis]MCG3402486.1 DUF4870 domain-containing protein [Staphylococcus massiliensis]MCG3411550.1 DUF4870 domain-containing protein [Staphylococcus massiliensis]PNZ98715.1 DUF4870 domain-containing protein [Staphylococcus massiliensis CCUG 55927]